MYQTLWKRPQAVVTAAILIGIGGLGLANANHFTSAPAGLNLKLADANQTPSRTGFAPVVKKALPSVVNILSVKVTKVPADFPANCPMTSCFASSSGARVADSLGCRPKHPNSAKKGWVLE